MVDRTSSTAWSRPGRVTHGREAAPRRQGVGAWYACYTRARAEKKVDLHLRRRGVESYLPLVPVERKWHDRKKVIEWPLFPSYVFVRESWSSFERVLSTPGVVAIVRMDGRPATIEHEEIENIASFASRIGTVGEEPKATTLERGQEVQIKEGPFQGLNAVVVEARGRHRVLIGLSAIQVGFEIDVSAESLSVQH